MGLKETTLSGTVAPSAEEPTPFGKWWKVIFRMRSFQAWKKIIIDKTGFDPAGIEEVDTGDTLCTWLCDNDIIDAVPRLASTGA
eukprot:11043245-Karenia_brevis.AAC.1